MVVLTALSWLDIAFRRPLCCNPIGCKKGIKTDGCCMCVNNTDLSTKSVVSSKAEIISSSCVFFFLLHCNFTRLKKLYIFYFTVHQLNLDYWKRLLCDCPLCEARPRKCQKPETRARDGENSCISAIDSNIYHPVENIKDFFWSVKNPPNCLQH